ncbi:MAG: polyprenyl synthetase family protein [Sphingobacteriales bacterium]|nr:MAG: polyprenyl synthetase family protein [Sphingobacteriales bacterium]TAF82807.1 MAG: polyprenyl synthetase family protein [Sphingobacteriales bacterium]
MHTILQLQQIIQKAIDEKQYPSHPKELYEPISYLMALGGKRLRPVLVLMATDLFAGDIYKAINAALAIETFHNFTLMHDDIMDNAPLRRGKPTVHAKWNQSVAILAGDVMFVESFKLIIQVDATILQQVLNVFNDTAVGVCEGQQIDMNFETAPKVTLADYIEMIRLKTAVLLGGALKIGALIGNANLYDAEKLYDFGVNLGIAFQLQDDILDVYGDPEKFGKQVGGDILANKKTFLLIKALELADEQTLNQLNGYLQNTSISPSEKVSYITAIYNKLNIKDIAQAQMITYAEISLKALNEINAPNERKMMLKEFANMLTKRDN